MKDQEMPLCLAVGGGKGGVGKTVVSVNLATALARHGARVVVVDTDFGAANAHTLLGVERPGATLQAFLNKKVASLEEVVIPTAAPRVFLIPGVGAIAGAANLAHAKKVRLLKALRGIDADVVLLDCGAGISFNVIDFFLLADLRFVVATPELTSIQNAYSFLKGSVHRLFRHQCTDAEQRKRIDTAAGGETERVSELLEKVQAQDPELGARLYHCLEWFQVGLIGNQIHSNDAEHVMFAFSRMTGDFLSVNVPMVGALGHTQRIVRSVVQRKPFMLEDSTSKEARTLMDLAERVLETNVYDLRENRGPVDVMTEWGPDVEPAELPRPVTQYRRQHDRFAVGWTALVRRGVDAYQIQLSDISSGGARLLSGDFLAEGDAISLSIEGCAALSAIVRHVDDRYAGIEFLNEVGDDLQAKLDKAHQTAAA